MSRKKMCRTVYSLIIYLLSSTNLILSQDLPVLNLSNALNNPTIISVSDFIESIEYIPLETTSESLVGNNPKIIVTDDYIITRTYRKCLVFSRDNGAFIRELGHYGRDPGGYKTNLGIFNELSSIYYFRGWDRDLIKYSLSGEFLGAITIELSDKETEAITSPDAFSYLNDTILVCQLVCLDGTEPYSFYIFDDNGNLLKAIPNKMRLSKKQAMNFSTPELKFHRYNGNVFFQCFYCDTIYKLLINDIKPAFILKSGKYLLPYESKWWSMEKRKRSDFITIPTYFENSRFIAFDMYKKSARYFGLYNKSNRSFKISENAYGILNNLDGFINPSFISINESEELAGFVNPKEILLWFEQNSDKMNSLRSEVKQLKGINESDNPVIIIAKFKK
jgi:hypothetical protein